MLEITNLVTPSPEQFMAVIKGMRLPFKSGDRSDSEICQGESVDKDSIRYCFVCEDECTPTTECFILGDNDEKLLLNLCSAGDPSHRKLLRQLPVIMDIKAPLYFFKQLDTYKVGTVAQSESTMHTLVKKEFEMSDFSTDDLLDDFVSTGQTVHGLDMDGEGAAAQLLMPPATTVLEEIIDNLNFFRDVYLETKNTKYWNAINKLLPQSYNQTRCWSGNYETLVNIINQRSNHKLKEWHTFCEYMLENVPYLKEIVEAVNGNRS